MGLPWFQPPPLDWCFWWHKTHLSPWFHSCSPAGFSTPGVWVGTLPLSPHVLCVWLPVSSPLCSGSGALVPSWLLVSGWDQLWPCFLSIPHILPPTAPPLVGSLIAGLVLPELEASWLFSLLYSPQVPRLIFQKHMPGGLILLFEIFQWLRFPWRRISTAGCMVSLDWTFPMWLSAWTSVQRSRNTHSPVRSGPGGLLALCVPLLLSGRPSTSLGSSPTGIRTLGSSPTGIRTTSSTKPSLISLGKNHFSLINVFALH